MSAASPEADQLRKHDQPKYVEIPLEVEKNDNVVDFEIDFLPQLENMLSCDLSVEESLTTNTIGEEENKKIYQESVCFGFAKKPVNPRPFEELEEKEEALKKFDLEGHDWKVGAIDSKKSRLPIEHDDREKPNAIELDCDRDDVPSLRSDKCTEHPEGELEHCYSMNVDL
jgi:hypothetical protein